MSKISLSLSSTLSLSLSDLKISVYCIQSEESCRSYTCFDCAVCVAAAAAAVVVVWCCVFHIYISIHHPLYLYCGDVFSFSIYVLL